MTADRVAQQALDRALDESEDLLLVYQPIHEARSRRIYAVEALLRQRRENGEIREAGIITAAAEHGPELFVLNSLTVRTAFTDAAEWMGRASGVRLNLNLSPREFEESDIVDRLESLIAGCRADMTRLNLEITETSYFERPEETIEALVELKRLGMQLWLDDFGTGHSSITQLQQFPLDGIKLPKEFVSEVECNRRCRAITRHLLHLAHDLGLEVIAEGVETVGELEFLLEHDCDYIQGFLFSSPMMLADVEELLRQSSGASPLPARARRDGDPDPSSPSS